MGTRTQRSESTRETETRLAQDNFTFEEQDNLAIPEVIKNRFADEGMALRWIRISVRGKDDIQNVGKRQQDGWVFVTPDEVEEMAYNSFVKEDGRYAGLVCRGDLALAKMSIARSNSRKEYYEKVSGEMMDAVNSQLQNHQDSRAPISNSSKSSVSVGKPTKFQS